MADTCRAICRTRRLRAATLATALIGLHAGFIMYPPFGSHSPIWCSAPWLNPSIRSQSDCKPRSGGEVRAASLAHDERCTGYGCRWRTSGECRFWPDFGTMLSQGEEVYFLKVGRRRVFPRGWALAECGSRRVRVCSSALPIRIAPLCARTIRLAMESPNILLATFPTGWSGR